MDWKEYAKELLIFQVKVFSLPIEDVSKEKIEEFKNEFNELKKMGKLDWDAEAIVENYYDEIGKIVDKLEKLLNNEELIFGNPIASNISFNFFPILPNPIIPIFVSNGVIFLSINKIDKVLKTYSTTASVFPPGPEDRDISRFLRVSWFI